MSDDIKQEEVEKVAVALADAVEVEKAEAEKAEAETKKEKFVLTDELREKASQKPVFNILYVGDGDSRLTPFRGESAIRTFSTFYEKHASINYYTANSKRLTTLTISDLRHVNILWIDNLSNFMAAKNLSVIIDQLTDEVHPKWKEELRSLSEKSPEEAEKFANDLRKKRQEKLRIIYALDEFIWEGIVGRMHDIQTVQLMESYMNMADAIVVPTRELLDVLNMYGFVNQYVEIYVIPTAVNIDFFPLFKDFTRRGKAQIEHLREKPNVLIKGLTMPENVQEFIVHNYKTMNITICSVDNVSDHIKGLIGRGKVTHIHHWANPMVNRSNIVTTCAIERDAGYDFVIHTKPDNMKGQLYEITTGDEDILFSIAYGALPICGVDHIGLDDEGNTLMTASGLTFGKDSPHERISKIVTLNQTPSLFNEAFGKCRAKVERRVITDTYIIARYFAVMLGREMSKARAMLAKEAQEKMDKNSEEKNVSAENRKIKDVRNQSSPVKTDTVNSLSEAVVGGLQTTEPLDASAEESPKTEENPENIIKVNFNKE